MTRSLSFSKQGQLQLKDSVLRQNDLILIFFPASEILKKIFIFQAFSKLVNCSWWNLPRMDTCTLVVGCVSESGLHDEYIQPRFSRINCVDVGHEGSMFQEIRS